MMSFSKVFFTRLATEKKISVILLSVVTNVIELERIG